MAAVKKAAIFPMPLDEGEVGMSPTKKHLTTARTLGVAIDVDMGLASCATYDDEFGGINSRLDQLDPKVQGAAQSAESANQSAKKAHHPKGSASCGARVCPYGQFSVVAVFIY